MSARPTTTRRTPDFFIAGHPKCGTTALYLMLRAHPQIYMPDLKEPQFFAPEMRAEELRSSPLPRTLDAYLALFAAAGPEQRAGEASPSYLRSKTAAAEIAELRPDARVVAILREPASFLRSVHLQFVQAMIEPEPDLRTALALEQERREGQRLPRNAYWPQALMYSEHVRYVEQLDRYRAVFPSQQLLVLIYDDFRGDNQAIARQVLRFLDVDDSLPIETIEANPSVQVRARRLHGATRAVHLAQGRGARAVKGAYHAIVPQRARRSLVRPIRREVRRRIVYRAPTPPDEDLMLELRRRFKHEVVALSEDLDRDLVTLWDYDKIA
jgi:hypothetical protein